MTAHRKMTRFAAYACQVPRTIYDDMAATGSRIGQHLQWAQRQSIEKLWQRACAPEGSATRQKLPNRCDQSWFCDTFCGGEGKGRSSHDGCWELVSAHCPCQPLLPADRLAF